MDDPALSTNGAQLATSVLDMAHLDQTLRDFRFAARVLSRNPRYSVVAALTLALGIGVLAAAFSVVDAVLLRPLPYPDAERLVWLADFDPVFQHDTWGSRADYRIWRADGRSFEQMTAYGNLDYPLVIDGEASQERVLSTEGDFWAMTGAQAATGRLFGAGERDCVVLSHELALRRFGDEQSAIGRTASIEGRPFTVVAVLPRSFRFLFPQQALTGDERREIDAYIPLPDAVETPGQPVVRTLGPAPWWISVVGKLRPGASIEQARAEMVTIHARIGATFPHPTRHATLTVAPLQEKIVGNVRRAVLVLLAAAAFVLLIAAANVGALVIAQASKRRREMAVRTALGAGTGRIARQFLVEGAVLALAGGGLGLLLAEQLLGVCVRLGAGWTPRLAEASIDGRVLTFALCVSLAAALVIGGGAFFARERVMSQGLGGESRSSAGGGLVRMRTLLVGAELALALVLLSGAGLMLASFSRMNERPAGYSPGGTLSMRIPLSGPRYETWPAKDAYIRELLDQLRRLPGVQAAGIDLGTYHTAVTVEGAVVGAEQPTSAVRMVSQGYLDAMGAPLVRGRLPTPSEELDAVVVNEAFVRRVTGGVDPVGKRIGGSFLRGVIVGVAADFKHSRLDAEPDSEVYYPYPYAPYAGSIRVLVKAQDIRATATSIREVAANLDPTQPVYRFATVEELLADSVAPRRFNLALLVSFAATALLMALAGIYGLMSFVVEQRTREVGIRMALGATRGQVVRMIVRQGMGVAVGGAVVGVAGALALTRAMEGLLYGVEPNDPRAFAVVSAGLLATALAACLGPAFKAASVDPVTSLRHE